MGFPQQKSGVSCSVWFWNTAHVTADKFRYVGKENLCMIAAKVYRMRWRNEEYFKFKAGSGIYRHDKFRKRRHHFYALRYAVKRILAGTRSGINGFLMKKVQSQQLTLAECFGIKAFRG